MSLVVTIIVLLILSGVTITVISGDNGIISKSQNMTNSTKRNQIITSVGVDILSAELKEDLTQSKLEEILDQYGDVQYDSEGNITGLLPDDLNEVIDIADIYTGEIAIEQKTISTTDSYVGYYADVNNDGTVDGIIYADLLMGVSITYDVWTIEYDKIDSTKDYTISDATFNQYFGEKQIITPASGSTGNARFYVMALTDATSGYWYASANGSLDTTYSVEEGENDFGKGKENTAMILEAWENEDYGAQNDGDIWNDIKDDIEEGWFVPSIGEWIVFSEALGIDWSITGSADYGVQAGLAYYKSSSESPSTYGTWYWNQAPWYCGMPYSNGSAAYSSSCRLSIAF